MNIHWLLIGFLILNLVLATMGDTAAKVWAITPGQKWFWITITLAGITSVSTMLVIRHSSLAVGNTMMLLLTMLFSVLIGFFVFREHVTAGQWVGIALGFVAVLFLLNVIKISP